MAESEESLRPKRPRMREGWVVKHDKPSQSSTAGPGASKPQENAVRPQRTYADARVPIMLRHFGKPGAKDWYMFAFELRTLIAAGQPFVEAVHILELHSERERVKRTAAVIGRLVDHGSTFESALAEARDLPPMIRSMLTMGHQTGTLMRMLEAVINHYAWLIELRSRIFKLVTYPFLLVVLGTFVMIARDLILAGIGGISPASSTEIVFGRYLIPLCLWSLAGFGVGKLLNSSFGRTVVDGALLTIPGVNTLARKFALTVFFNTFAAALDAGMPVTRAYELASNSTPNRVIAGRLRKWERFLRDGESISTTLKQTRVVDREALGIIAVGEQASTPSSLMRRLATWYDDQIRTVIKMVISIVAPFFVLMVALGYFANFGMLLTLAFLCCILIALA